MRPYRSHALSCNRYWNRFETIPVSLHFEHRYGNRSETIPVSIHLEHRYCNRFASIPVSIHFRHRYWNRSGSIPVLTFSKRPLRYPVYRSLNRSLPIPVSYTGVETGLCNSFIVQRSLIQKPLNSQTGIPVYGHRHTGLSSKFRILNCLAL